MGVGRFFCVALPFILTAGSLLTLLIATLAGVADQNLYMFQVNTTDLEINPSSLLSLVGARDVDWRHWQNDAASSSDIKSVGSSTEDDTATTNLTAADLGLSNLYDISLWGYCVVDQDNKHNCTKAEFNWAATYLNTTSLKAESGEEVEMPEDITKSLQAFATLAKWTEVVFIIALISLAVELFFGIFATCSRFVSCITYLLAGIASVFVCGAAAMATAQAALVVGTVEATAKWYGVGASFNNTFLVLIWLSALQALAAGFFWLFTICCCAPSRSDRHSRKRNTQDAEKLLPTGAYAPLREAEHTGYISHSPAPQYNAPGYVNRDRTDIAYEPYAHRG